MLAVPNVTPAPVGNPGGPVEVVVALAVGMLKPVGISRTFGGAVDNGDGPLTTEEATEATEVMLTEGIGAGSASSSS